MEFWENNASAIQAVMAVVTVALLILGPVCAHVIKSKKPKTIDKFIPKGKKLFLSAPMSSLNADPASFRKYILSIMNCFQSETGANLFSAYVAYYDEDAPDGYLDDPTPSMTKEIIKQVKECDAFVLIFPEKTTSSSLIEIGFALALKKPCLVFHGPEALPWLLRPEALINEAGHKVNLVKINSLDDVAYHVKQRKMQIFW